MTKKLMILPGDGIGPEIIDATRLVINWINENTDLTIQTEEGLIGGQSYDAYDHPFTDETLEACHSCDAILMGSVGGPQWDNVNYSVRPEAGILKLRKALDLFANIRPAKVFDALIDASSLKPEIVKGFDIVIVRELTGGVYFGEPRGIEPYGNERRGINTHSYTTSEIHRVAHVAFQLAQKRGKKVHSCDKANVMEAGKLWREEVTLVQQQDYLDIHLEHMLADNCSMQLVSRPSQFDVILTDNLFGDMLSDQASSLTGSLGMLPSASMGAADTPALYEPIHGSAPDIAGQGISNPLATILSFAMCLRYSFERGDLADKLESAVDAALAEGHRTADILGTNKAALSTLEMAHAVVSKL